MTQPADEIPESIGSRFFGGAARRFLLLLFFLLATVALTGFTIRNFEIWFVRTKTLTFAVSHDGPDRRFAARLAGLVQANSRFTRLKLVETDDPGAVFDRRESDFAILRSDARLPGWTRAVADIEKEILLVIGRKGAKLGALAALKGRELILPAPAQKNDNLLRAILDAGGVKRSDAQITVAADAATLGRTFRNSPSALIFVVTPLSRLVQGNFLRDLALDTPISLLDLPDAKALSKKLRGLADETVEAGLVNGAPALPAEDLDTASLNDLLVTRSQLRETVVAEIARLVFENKADLAEEGVFATSIEPPDTDKDASVIAHPGAAQYVNDDEKTFLDRYSDMIYLGMPVASIIGSFFIWLYTRMTHIAVRPARDAVDEVLRIAETVRGAGKFEELDAAEDHLNEILHRVLRDLQEKKMSPDGLEVFRLAYEQTRDWMVARRRSLEDKLRRVASP